MRKFPTFYKRKSDGLQQDSISELFSCQEHFIVSLSSIGLCTSFNKSKKYLKPHFIVNGEITILNLSEKEKIRSIFLNSLNDSIFIVSVKEDNDCSKMKCRSLSFKALIDRDIEKHTKKLFQSFVLKWPDFIEFDELNGKIVTKHSEEKAFRVWCL